MKGVKKYKTFLEARLDMYREMWERGFQKERVAKFLRDFEASIKRFNLPASKVLYPPGIYLFKSFENARNDLKKRIKKNDNP
ncbi:hypothetical protein BXT86_04490 [candidate division WOR-3 bacterium 4484_100]|uniref:Uncharacterized protein n=1 Tax=candidate division WOR-3 bacterium 4484_100 TaxID=1936077 RepID=A0A1V4QG31_UNCW3|nr:MAG: hypothetical protein BXT86_04490 [candidate division WOR-3 bacterium 4484_100]